MSQLNAQVKKLLNNAFPLVVVEGEISGLHHHRSSGHYYFNLKDERAILRCVMFAGNASRLSFQPEDGLKVLVRTEISLYEREGRYQAVIQHMEPHGEGELRLAIERLRAKLQAKGWFENELKKPLPTFPKHIVIISSPKGAATQDVYVNIWRRYPPVKLSLQPASVQGQLAESEICQAIAKTHSLEVQPDFVILTRGGGSLEDLAAFNSEQVAMAIHESEIPIVSAVGHDVDFTIADFVADLRAPTPSTAAELVTPDGQELWIRFDEFVMNFDRSVRIEIDRLKTNTSHVQFRLRNPRRDVANNQQRLSDRIKDLKRTQSQQLTQRTHRITHLQRVLNQVQPGIKLQHHGTRIRNAQVQICKSANALNRENSTRVDRATEKLVQLNAHWRERTNTKLHNVKRALIQVRPVQKIKHLRTRTENTTSILGVRASEKTVHARRNVESVIKNLDAVSPLAVLQRGYAVVTKPVEGTHFGAIAKGVDDVQPGERIQTHVSDGTIYSKVTSATKRSHTETNEPETNK